MTEQKLKELGFVKSGKNSLFHQETDIELRHLNIRTIKPHELLYRFGCNMFEAGKKAGINQQIDKIKELIKYV